MNQFVLMNFLVVFSSLVFPLFKPNKLLKSKKKNQGHFSSSLSIVWAVINPEKWQIKLYVFFCMWNNSESPIKKSYSLIIILEPKKRT